MAFHFLHGDFILVFVIFKVISNKFSCQTLLLPEKWAAVLDVWQVLWDDTRMLTSQSKIWKDHHRFPDGTLKLGVNFSQLVWGDGFLFVYISVLVWLNIFPCVFLFCKVVKFQMHSLTKQFFSYAEMLRKCMCFIIIWSLTLGILLVLARS